MKKFFVFLSLFLMTFALSSCESACKVETLGENGEKVTYTIQKTEDKEEVVSALTALSTVVPVEEEYTGLQASLKANFLLKSGEEKIDFSGSANWIMQPETLNFSGSLDAKLGLNLSTASGLSMSMKDTYQFSGKLYGDISNLYTDISLKSNSLDMGMKYKFNLSDIFPSDDELPPLDQTSPAIPDLSTLDLAEIVEKYQITIPKTTSNTVTFRLALPASELSAEITAEAYLYVYAEVDIHTLLPVSFKVDAEEMLTAIISEDTTETITVKCSVEGSVKYGEYLPTVLTEEQKSDYEDFTGLEDNNGSLV